MTLPLAVPRRLPYVQRDRTISPQSCRRPHALGDRTGNRRARGARRPRRVAVRALVRRAARDCGKRRPGARRIRAAPRRLRQLSHRREERRRVPRRWPGAGLAVRHLLHLEHHARSRDRPRRLVDGSLRARHDGGHLTGRAPLFPGFSVPFVHQGAPGRSGRPQGLSRYRQAGRQRRARPRPPFPLRLSPAAQRLAAAVFHRRARSSPIRSDRRSGTAALTS